MLFQLNGCIIAEITEMLPGILNQLGAENLASLKKLASTVAGSKYMRLPSLTTILSSLYRSLINTLSAYF